MHSSCDPIAPPIITLVSHLITLVPPLISSSCDPIRPLHLHKVTPDPPQSIKEGHAAPMAEGDCGRHVSAWGPEGGWGVNHAHFDCII